MFLEIKHPHSTGIYVRHDTNYTETTPPTSIPSTLSSVHQVRPRGTHFLVKFFHFRDPGERLVVPTPNAFPGSQHRSVRQIDHVPSENSAEQHQSFVHRFREHCLRTSEERIRGASQWRQCAEREAKRIDVDKSARRGLVGHWNSHSSKAFATSFPRETDRGNCTMFYTEMPSGSFTH